VIAAVSDDCGKDLKRLETEAHTLAGMSFNLGSNREVAEVLFVKLGQSVLKRTPKGQPSVNEEVLKQLAERGMPLAQTLSSWRSAKKLKGAFADKLPKHINANTGRVHTTFNLTGAKTGRLSSSEPNLQQIPAREARGRLIRRAFIAPPGHFLVAADYSQIELRVLAHMSGDPGLIAAFHEGHDFHTATAAKVFGIPLETVSKEQRRRAKAVNFGIVYGITHVGLARDLGIGPDEAQDIIEAHFKAYPGLPAYIHQMRARASQDRAARTLFGRKVHLLDMARSHTTRNLAINAPIQGTAADLIRRAMLALPTKLQEASLGSRLLLSVHDELVLEASEAEVKETIKVVRQVMEAAGEPEVQFRVPIVVEVKHGLNWADAH
jgi:DNA polymerase-1